LRILAIIPALNLEVNDIGQALSWIANQGNDVLCLAARQNPSKSRVKSASRETLAGLTIVRPWTSYELPAEAPELAAMLALRALPREGYDVVLCIQDYNLPLARRIQRIRGSRAPTVVLVEQAGRLATSEVSNTRLQLSHRLHGFRSRPEFFKWVAASCQMVITCDPSDLGRMESLQNLGSRVEYVPWCTDPGCRRAGDGHDEGTAIYAGSLTRNKNPDTLLAVARRLIEESVIHRFTLVLPTGKGATIDRWKSALGTKLSLHSSLDLGAVAKLIERAQFGLTAASPGGWGFIGNCWALKTPVVMLEPNEFLTEPSAAFEAWRHPDPLDALSQFVRTSDRQLIVQNAGYEVFERFHSARAVGERIIGALRSVV
jgi:glycosyltransferase involved in cell wall biosynthesis